ncbi:MAG: hypothetical protein ACFN1H_04520 [Propionibacterium freudenreichii]
MSTDRDSGVQPTPTSPDDAPLPPVTGNDQVDRALAALGQLQALDVEQRIARLGAAQEQLQAILNGSRDAGIPMPDPPAR